MVMCSKLICNSVLQLAELHTSAEPAGGMGAAAAAEKYGNGNGNGISRMEII